MDSPRRLDSGALAALLPIAIGLYATYGEDISYERIKNRFRDTMVRDPIDSLAAVVLVGSYLFYAAEKDVNPKVNGFLDALVFVTTSLSVGYDDVFARTSAGKMIASFVQTFGPALATSALQRRGTDPDEHLQVERAMLDRLDAILEAIRGQSGDKLPATQP